jgi:hypothetical protein
MANGDKDDKKKKRNVRVLRPQGSGTTTSFGDVVEGAGKFARGVGTVISTPFKAIAEQQKKIEAGRLPTLTRREALLKTGIEPELKISPLAGRVGKDSSDPTPEKDLSDQAKAPRFFGDMGQPTTGTITDTSPDKQEVSAIGKPDWEIEAEKFLANEKAAIVPFDDDGDGELSDRERDNQKAFQREERIRGYKESTERNKAKFAEISARLEARRKQASDLERKEDQALIDEMGDELTAKANAQQKQDRRKLFATVRSLSDQGKLDTDTYNKLKAREGGLVGVSPEQFDKAFERAGIIPMDTPAQVGGLRRKDFGSTAGFLAAVRGQQADTPSGSAAAAQKVMDSRGLGREKAMQSDDYVLGSGSALRRSPRELGTRSGAMNRAGRRLLRKGAWGEAQKMFGAAEAQKLSEGSAIQTPEQRKRLEAQQKRTAELMSGLQQMMDDYKEKRSNIGIAGYPTSNIQQSPRN